MRIAIYCFIFIAGFITISVIEHTIFVNLSSSYGLEQVNGDVSATRIYSDFRGTALSLLNFIWVALCVLAYVSTNLVIKDN